MTYGEFSELYTNDSQVAEVTEWLANRDSGKAIWKNISGSLRSLLGYGVFQNTDANHLFILNEKEEAAYFLNDLENLLGEKHVFFFPGSYRRPYQIEETDNANVLLRAEVLNQLNGRKKPAIIVTYPDGLFEKVITRKELVKNTLRLKVGEKVNLDFVTETLFEYHFEHVDFVVEPGQFSTRGGIIDVFSFSNDLPYRIEFFDDEVESIRTFDVETQMSEKMLKQLTIIPNVADKIHLETRESFLDYLPNNTIIWHRDEKQVAHHLDKQYTKATEIYKELGSETTRSEPEKMFLSGEQWISSIEKFRTIAFGPTSNDDFDIEWERDSLPQPSFNKHFPLLVENLQANTADKFTNLILCSVPKQVERFYAIFEDIGANVEFTPIVSTLHEGFIDRNRKIVAYTDHQIFERYQKFRLKTGFAKKQAITLKELTGLQVGDFVTHIDHGIGKFGGLQKIDVNGKQQEAIKIIYKDGDILYVSIHSLHKVSKYNGKEGTEPKIHKLGSGAWNKVKAKTKARVKSIAYDLIKLYAERKAKNGFAFSPDTYLQHELEASFIYEDTPDQLKATQDVKQDMEKDFPMDRLVCGDVGFGKTEVAIRAAFKAAVDGKQVAVLVPTTILAFQHYKTFSERLSEFPVEVDYLNRFKPKKEQTKTLKKLAEGKVDIVIGTHRLVGKDVKFKDLGLLVIDEEQKFGVAVKDKLKTIKVNVDTLTLSATPIPRTLQFSLMGARDLSVINTPPPNRYPVHTEVRGFNEELIRDAIVYEVSRGGQVFFVHNRIENIKEIAGMINRLCPDVKVGIGHGQMEGEKLEKLMLGFMNNEFDVLISTTIIESGLDISNANTIIINHAQLFGLSDLHQMRGRVGRSNKKAFCYLLAPPYISMTEDARKRLKALEQFTDLGSGFNISMRDLEIRGAGDLLGAEQSGFIGDIGFDMYQKILNEAIEELKEKEFADLYKEESEKKMRERGFVRDSQIDTDLEILIPDDYVNNIAERLDLYRRLDNINEPNELNQFEKELIDRFGELPSNVADLLDLVRLRWLAQRLGFEKVVLKNEKMVGYFISDQNSPFFQSESFTRILNFLKDHFREVQMKEKNNRLMMSFPRITSVKKALHILEKILS